MGENSNGSDATAAQQKALGCFIVKRKKLKKN